MTFQLLPPQLSCSTQKRNQKSRGREVLGHRYDDSKRTPPFLSTEWKLSFASDDKCRHGTHWPRHRFTTFVDGLIFDERIGPCAPRLPRSVGRTSVSGRKEYFTSRPRDLTCWWPSPVESRRKADVSI